MHGHIFMDRRRAFITSFIRPENKRLEALPGHEVYEHQARHEPNTMMNLTPSISDFGTDPARQGTYIIQLSQSRN